MRCWHPPPQGSFAGTAPVDALLAPHHGSIADTTPLDALQAPSSWLQSWIPFRKCHPERSCAPVPAGAPILCEGPPLEGEARSAVLCKNDVAVEWRDTVTIVAVDSRWVAAKGTLSETKQEHKHGRMCETPAERGAPIHGAGGASSPNQTKQTIGCPSGGKSRVVQGAPNGGNKYRPIRRPQDKCTGPKGWPGRQRKNIPFACRQVARPRGRCGGHGAPAECPTSPSQGAPLGGRHPQVAFGAAHRAQYVSKTHVQSFLIHC
eukprot:gene23619-biopygen11852